LEIREVVLTEARHCGIFWAGMRETNEQRRGKKMEEISPGPSREKREMKK